MFARLNRYARYACAPMAALALWAVLVAVLPATANAEQTPRTNARANAQDTDHRPDHHVVVAPGDCLWSISERQLGPGATGPQIAKGVERIYALNRDVIGADPDLIFVGQRFALPRSLERPGAVPVSRRAREPARAAHAGAPAARPGAAREDRSAGSGPARATDQAADRLAEDSTGRTTNVPVAAHTQDAPEMGSLPDGAVAPRVPAVRHPSVRVPSSSPVSYLGDVRARVSSIISTLIDAVVTDDRYAARQLLGWALLLISSGIGVFAIVRATWRTVARYEREERSRQRAAAYSAAPMASRTHPRVRERPPGRTKSVRSEEPGRSEDPAGPTQDESKGGIALEGPRRNAGRPGSRGRSAVRTKPRRRNRRRKVVSESQEVPDAGREWQVGEGLRHSLEDLPLRPDAMGDVLAELQPQFEKELRCVALVERRRTLSNREHRQADALRDLLVLARHYPSDKG